MERPRILLVPALTEVEWAIKPLLERWADVASYDTPGIGSEPAFEGPYMEGAARRGLTELDHRGWDRCVVVADSLGAPAAIGIAAMRREAVAGLVLGHACVEYVQTGERPSINPAIAAAMTQLSQLNFRTFIRQDLANWDTRALGGGLPDADAIADAFIERVQPERARAFYAELATLAGGDGVSVEPGLRAVQAPLMLVQHEDCVVYTPEGFEDAVAAFPKARVFRTPVSPTASPRFADELRRFCAELPAPLGEPGTAPG